MPAGVTGHREVCTDCRQRSYSKANSARSFTPGSSQVLSSRFLTNCQLESFPVKIISPFGSTLRFFPCLQALCVPVCSFLSFPPSSLAPISQLSPMTTLVGEEQEVPSRREAIQVGGQHLQRCGKTEQHQGEETTLKQPGEAK